VEYIRNLVGIEAVGIGADFMDYLEDIAIPYFVQMGCPKSIATYPTGISSVADVNVLFHKMLERGFIETEIHKLAYSNFADCFKKQLKPN
jgi:microsomal dipeptidase-like Zn-dependent dipeptidase